MPERKSDDRARLNGKTRDAVDPANVSDDGISAEELHPEAEVGPSVSDEVERAVANPEPINVEDLHRLEAEKKAGKGDGGR